MRQNIRRQPPAKRADEAADLAAAQAVDLSVAAGAHLDLGMVVSVYHASSAAPQAENDAGPCVTEH